jgi:hypothetical protein
MLSCFYAFVSKVEALSPFTRPGEAHVIYLLLFKVKAGVIDAGTMKKEGNKLSRCLCGILLGHHFDLSEELLMKSLIFYLLNSVNSCVRFFLG